MVIRGYFALSFNLTKVKPLLSAGLGSGIEILSTSNIGILLVQLLDLIRQICSPYKFS